MTVGTRLRWALGGALAVSVGLATVVAQRAQPSMDELMASLVTEVRLLRQAVEQSGATSSRAQLLLGRVTLQEGRLATLGRQLQEARARVRAAQAEHHTHERELSRVNAAGPPSNPQEREGWDVHLREMKRMVAQSAATVTELRADDTAAESALAAEQDRWRDFNDRLETLERELAAPASRPR